MRSDDRPGVAAKNPDSITVMNHYLLAFLGTPEIIGILVVVLIMFGAKKVPELARGLGQGIREFKKASNEIQDDLERSIEAPPPKPRSDSMHP